LNQPKSDSAAESRKEEPQKKVTVGMGGVLMMPGAAAGTCVKMHPAAAHPVRITHAESKSTLSDSNSSVPSSSATAYRLVRA
jgi:hypothetical protein